MVPDEPGLLVTDMARLRPSRHIDQPGRADSPSLATISTLSVLEESRLPHEAKVRVANKTAATGVPAGAVVLRPPPLAIGRDSGDR